MRACSLNPQKIGVSWPFRTLLMVALIVTAGCGKKTPPRPIGFEKPPQVVDIRAELINGQVRLTWPIPAIFYEKKRLGDLFFVVQRERTNLERVQCGDCPPEAVQTMVRIDPAIQGPWKVDHGMVQWTDTSAKAKEVYRYWIAIVDKKERLLSVSAPTRVYLIAPPRPVKKVETRADQRGLLVRWDAPAAGNKMPDPKTSYLIERRQKGLAWEALNPQFFQGNSYLDTSVQPQEHYQYRVRPVLRVLDAEVPGPWTESALIRAPERVPPPPPTTVWAVPSKEKIEVYWTESSLPVGGYIVYRRDGKTIVRLTAEPLNKPPFIDAKVEPNKVYAYAVSAVSPDAPHKEGLLSKWVEVRYVRFN